MVIIGVEFVKTALCHAQTSFLNTLCWRRMWANHAINMLTGRKSAKPFTGKTQTINHFL
jgi:hypothetical protein